MERCLVRGTARSAALVGLVTGMAACAAVKRPQFTELLWPEPPLTPRIKFVGLLRSRNDLGRNVAELVADALVGGKKVPDSIERPMGIVPERSGERLYVTDYDNGRVLVFNFEARTMQSLGDEAHGFARPFGIAVDDKDNVYVVDSALKLVRVFDSSGRFLRNLTHESLERPTGIAIDARRRKVYVVDSASKDSENHVVHVFDLDGTYLKALGGLGTEDGKFFFPTYVAVDGDGKLYVSDTLNARVQVFDADGHHLMNIGKRGDTFGMFDKPKGVAVDTFGNVYVADSTWSNIQIFNSRGEVLLYFAGRGHIPGLLFNPTGIAIDNDNRIYVADAFNNRVAIYQLVNTKPEDSFSSVPPSETGRRGVTPQRSVQRATAP
ncbi:MAG: SBBP repeat-containing protein [Candidatus Binatia bacterium]